MVTFDYTKTPITQIADHIISYAANHDASDIHFDPRDEGLMVRIRMDGQLIDYTFIPKTYERNLTTRLKLLANMNITESRLPQDGAIKGKIAGLDLDMRVSSLPTSKGEKIVIRILDYSRSLSGIDSLGFNSENFTKLQRMMNVPNGIILITGATGSGKSTTVYSILQVLNKEDINIITVEDPIEMSIEGMNQVQVNSEIGLDFATVLRSVLRQDPNVILIGEIRDSETAQIAVRASITGHLVLSTIHTNNSLSTIERLLDMNVERYLLSSAMTGIISQRLAKMLCPKCSTTRDTTPYEKIIFKQALNKDVKDIKGPNLSGCEECHGGYHGRIAIQEVLEIADEIRDALNDASLEREELRRLVYGSGDVITLLQDGLGKVLDGKTSFEEIYRIIEIDNDIDDSYFEEDSDEETVPITTNKKNLVHSDLEIEIPMGIVNEPENTEIDLIEEQTTPIKQEEVKPIELVTTNFIQFPDEGEAKIVEPNFINQIVQTKPVEQVNTTLAYTTLPLAEEPSIMDPITPPPVAETTVINPNNTTLISNINNSVPEQVGYSIVPPTDNIRATTIEQPVTQVVESTLPPLSVVASVNEPIQTINTVAQTVAIPEQDLVNVANQLQNNLVDQQLVNSTPIEPQQPIINTNQPLNPTI